MVEWQEQRFSDYEHRKKQGELVMGRFVGVIVVLLFLAVLAAVAVHLTVGTELFSKKPKREVESKPHPKSATGVLNKAAEAQLKKALRDMKAPVGTRFTLTSQFASIHSLSSLSPRIREGVRSTWFILALEVKDENHQWKPTLIHPVEKDDISGTTRALKALHNDYVISKALTEVPPSVTGSWKFQPYTPKPNTKEYTLFRFRPEGTRLMEVNGEGLVTSDLGDYRDGVVASLQFNRAKGGLDAIGAKDYWKSIEKAAAEHNTMSQLEKEIIYGDIDWEHQDTPEK